MGAGKQRPGGEVVQGTLDMLVLKILSRGSMHGWGIAQQIQQISDDVLRVEEGSLYPALHRLEAEGFLDSGWGVSENNRRAKYYRITRLGARRLAAETQNWGRLSGAIDRILQTV